MKTIRFRMLAGAAALAICFTAMAGVPDNATADQAAPATELPQVYHPSGGGDAQISQPSPTDFSEMAIRLFGALLLVVGLFLGGAWLFKRTKLFNTVSAREANLQVVESKSLGSRHSLHVVTYGRQRFLISDTPAGTEFLANLDEPPAEPKAEDPPSEGSFVAKLKQAIEGQPREQATMRDFVSRMKNFFARKTS